MNLRTAIPAIVIATLGMVFAFYCLGEPRYHGRTLTSWLQQCSDTPLMEAKRLADAQAAVRAMPIGKVLPRLLELVEAKDDPASVWIRAKCEKLQLNFLKWYSAQDLQLLGIAGFEALETNAAPAVGDLTTLLDDDEHAFPAVRCLIAIGIPAQAGVKKALASKNQEVRYFATQQFAWVTDDDRVYLAQMKNCLKDPDATIRFAAVQGIGLQKQAPDLAVPLLIEALADHQDTVSSWAAKFLGEFGTNALAAFNVLTNAAINGSPSTSSQALRALVAIAPDKALPIVFNNWNSIDPRRRNSALQTLCTYSMSNPGILSAIELAAKDTNPKIARYAQSFLTKKYQEEHSDEPLFSNEPSYAGKSLGEWLGEHNRDGEFSQNAKDALRQLGTNAIPALFERLVYVRPPFGTPAFEVNISAVRGFIALGDAAQPALPQLVALMDGTSQYVVLNAMMSACGTGSNAVPVLIKGLTNQFADVRNEAANNLAEGVGAKFPELRNAAIPVFLSLLNDPDENVRRNATNELKAIDPEAAAKAGIK